MLKIAQSFFLGVIIFILFSYYAKAGTLPSGFVYLHDVSPTILQDMRYESDHNFVGRPVPGYAKRQDCILTKEAAIALSNLQKSLTPYHFSLKVYDCYRPTEAVAYFVAWSKDPTNQKMKAEFYPHIDKKDVFKLGYVAAYSGHSRGSTVDLTMVSLKNLPSPHYHLGEKLVACTAPFPLRFHDTNIDMGTGFDCLDPLAHFDAVDKHSLAFKNRAYLRAMMEAAGFQPYENEWWHFVLKNEPYPHSYFNFKV